MAFPTASVLATLQVNSGSPNSAALVSSQDGQYLRGFTNPLRTGDYSSSALDPATGVAWLVSSDCLGYGWGVVGRKGESFFFLVFDVVGFSFFSPFSDTQKNVYFPQLQLSEQGQTYSVTNSNNWVSSEDFVFGALRRRRN